MVDIVLSLSLGAAVAGCLAFYLCNRSLRMQLSARRVARAAEEVLGMWQQDGQSAQGDLHRGAHIRSI